MAKEILMLAMLALSSFMVSKFVVFLAQKKQWLDVPNSRSSHKLPTPKSGGIAFVIVFYLSVLYCFFLGVLSVNQLMALSIGLVLAFVGLLDDLKNLNIKVRISVHVICVATVVGLLGGAPDLVVFGITLSLGWLGFLVSVLAFTWFLNLYNFMDGIDGLATMEAIFVSLAASFFCWQQGGQNEMLIFLYLAASLLGFLFVNYPPAIVFMGDVGSNFLGLIIGALALITIHQGLMTLWAWSILLAVFIVDSTSTLYERYHAGEVWYHGHRSHFYQQAAIKYGSHSKVSLAVSAINVFWLFPLAWVSLKFDGWGWLIALLAYLSLIYISASNKSKMFADNAKNARD